MFLPTFVRHYKSAVLYSLQILFARVPIILKRGKLGGLRRASVGQVIRGRYKGGTWLRETSVLGPGEGDLQAGGEETSLFVPSSPDSSVTGDRRVWHRPAVICSVTVRERKQGRETREKAYVIYEFITESVTEVKDAAERKWAGKNTAVYIYLQQHRGCD